MQEALSTQTTYFATTGFDAFVPVPVPTSAESAVIGPSNVQSEAVEAATADLESTGPLSELSSACLPPGKDIADVVRDISLGVVQEDELSRYPKDVVQNVLDVIQQVRLSVFVSQRNPLIRYCTYRLWMQLLFYNPISALARKCAICDTYN